MPVRGPVHGNSHLQVLIRCNGTYLPVTFTLEIVSLVIWEAKIVSKRTLEILDGCDHGIC